MDHKAIDTACQYPLRVSQVYKEGSGWIVKTEHASGNIFLELQAFQNNMCRIRLYRDRFIALPSNYVGALPQTVDMMAEENQNKIVLRTVDFEIHIGKEPFSFCILNGEGEIVYQEQMDDVDSVAEGFHRIEPMGFSFREDGSTDCCLNAVLHYDEHIYGLGEHYTEFDRRGQKIVMWNRDTLGCRDGQAYKNIPFYVSSRGYGLFVNDGAPVEFHIGELSNASLQVKVPGQCMEAYLFVGQPRQAVSEMMKLTGPAVLPPDWSFGLWYSTGFQGASRESMMADAEIFRNKEIPCDVLHFDCYWLRENQWCDFVWNDKMYPKHQEMLAQLHRMGYKVCLWMNPYVTVCTQMYREGCDRGAWVRNKKGDAYKADLWHGLLPACVILDVTNPEGVEWFQNKLRVILREGVDVLKTDFGEEIPEDAVFYNGMTGRQMHNVYSNLYNEIVWKTVQEEKKEGIVWGRSGTAGMQRFPVCWSGDPRSCYEGMAGTLRGGLSLSMSGVPFWSHDMAGFYGKVTPEVFVRWSQFGLFTSHCRLHGTSSRQPWAYGKRAERIVSNAIRLRYRLMPYILKTAKECIEYQEPFLRPLVWAHPDDPAVANVWDEYYFGPALLVAPVFDGDGAKRNVYLPDGMWCDLETDEIFEGGKWHCIQCPLEKIPVFYRQGSRPEMGPDIPTGITARKNVLP